MLEASNPDTATREKNKINEKRQEFVPCIYHRINSINTSLFQSSKAFWYAKSSDPSSKNKHLLSSKD
jgi:hypothetical protein